MGVHSHQSEHPWLGSMAYLITPLINLVQKRFRFSIPVRHRVDPGTVVGGKRACVLIVLICSSLWWPLVALSQEIDEGEFSRTMLGYKLQLLKNQFEQTEIMLLTRCVVASNAKKLEHIYSEIKRLETEFRCGKYYPDLLDEQIVIVREELRLILALILRTVS